MRFNWDPAKNEEIKETHGISFEEIVDLVARGGLVKATANPSAKYPGQKVMLVRKGKSILLVPYENRGGTHWLITAFYSETLTRKYSRQK